MAVLNTTQSTSAPSLLSIATNGPASAAGEYEVVLQFDQPVRTEGGRFWLLEYYFGFGDRWGVELAGDDPRVAIDGSVVTVRAALPLSGGRVSFDFRTGAFQGLDGTDALPWPYPWFEIRQADSLDTTGPFLELDSALNWTGVLPQAAQPLHLPFDEALRPGSGIIVLRTTAGEVLESFDISDTAAVVFEGPGLTLLRTEALTPGLRYVVEIPAGALLDATGNASVAMRSEYLSAPVQSVASAAGGPLMGADTTDMLLGSNADDIFTGFGEDDQLYGGPGLDTAVFRGARHEYRLGTKSTNHPSSDAFTSAIVVRDQVAGRDGSDTIDGIEVLRFSDYTVDMRVAGHGEVAVFATDEPASLNRLLELYVGFFDRIPEAAGLVYWIGRLVQGATFELIAQSFHEAGVAFGVYAAGQPDEAYIAAVYGHLLDRGPGHAQAPTAQEIGYWRTLLQDGSHTRASMVLQMLDDVRAFEGDATYGWVTTLLTHKTALAQYYAIEQGLGRLTRQDDIDFGQQLADLVTPESNDQAKALIGLGNGPLWASSLPTIQGTAEGGENLQGDVYFASLIHGGGGSGDTLRGGAGDDRMHDDGGAATLIGGGGGDQYTVSGGDDTIIEADVFGSDHVTSHGNFELPDHVEGLTLLSGTLGIGNRLDNSIYGGSGNDRLEGRDGFDTLIGNAGNDTLEGGNGNDELSGRDGDDLLSGGAGDDLLYTGTGHDTLQGGDGFDTAWFAGNQSLYTITQEAAQVTVTGPDRVITLQEVERLQFQDGIVEVDALVALVGLGDAAL